MDDKDWKILNTLHEERSITKTAKRLFFTQPTVSAKIKQLEKDFGCQLVIRGARGISFTPQGELLCRFSSRYLHDFYQIKNALQPTSGELTGTLNIGCASVYGKYKMIDILHGFDKAYPAIDIRLRTGISQHIYDLLNSGAIQIGIIRGEYPWSGTKHLLCRDPYCIVNAVPLELSKLPQYPMIFRLADRPLQTSLHDWWINNFDSPPHVRIEVDNLDLCMEMVRKGLGYTLLSLTGSIPNLWTQVLCDNAKQPLMRSSWLYLGEQCETNPIVKAFTEYLINYEAKQKL